MCKRSEAKAFLRHGRVTFEGDVVTRPEQRVIVRYVGGPIARTARLPRSSTTWTFFRGERFFQRRERFDETFGVRRNVRRRRSFATPPLTPRPLVSARRLYDGVHVDGKPIPVARVADKENVDVGKEA